MAEYSDVTRESVLKAMGEYDQLGQQDFLEKYGYRPAWKYVIVTPEGNEYDSKAILGVACGYEHPDSGVPPYDTFPGGIDTVVPHLLSLGFKVRDLTSDTLHTPESDEANAEIGTARVSIGPANLGPLILVQNEVTATEGYDFWKDATGERYHFPNQYRNRIQEGRPFVYYRGVRRADGSSGTPEYFGWGRIGDVWRDEDIPESDPKSSWRWFCDIEEYHPFETPVPAKIDGEYLEDIEHQNLWQVGVREISRTTFSRILDLASYTPAAGDDGSGAGATPSPAEASGEEQTRLLVTPKRRSDTGKAATSGSGSTRRSRFSKVVGDWAEEFIFGYLQKTLPKGQADTVRWVARDGETPGWDVEYTNENGKRIGVEVKGTMGPAFPNFELTANEWLAAERLGHTYTVFLVAECRTSSPKIQRIDNPYGEWQSGNLEVRPSTWLVRSPPRS